MQKKNVLAVNDLSSIGKCSMGVVLPILSAMRVEVCPVVTAVLSAHTGFENPYVVDLTEHLDGMFRHILQENDTFSFAYSGYLGSNLQMKMVGTYFSKLQKKGTKCLIDPVLGDNGELYSAFNQESIVEMKELCRHADLITPNFTEACFLADFPYQETDADTAVSLAEALSKGLQVPCVVITGVPAQSGKAIVVWENGTGYAISCDYVKGEYCGTGDAFSSVLCGALVNGSSLIDAVQAAHRFVREAIQETYRLGGTWKDGIMLEQFLHLLI